MFGYSIKDILVQLGVGVLSTAITSALASIFTEKPAVIFIWGLCAFALGIIISNQLLYRKTLQGGKSGSISTTATLKKAEASPLKIEFEGESNVRWLTENNPLFKTTTIQRRFYGITVHNDCERNINSVSVEIERIEQIPDRDDEVIPPYHPYLGLKCYFKPKNLSMTLTPRQRERVPLISYVHGMFLDHEIRVESSHGYKIHHNNKRQSLYVKVTGSEVMPVTKRFTAWVNADGVLQMVAGWLISCGISSWSWEGRISEPRVRYSLQLVTAQTAFDSF